MFWPIVHSLAALALFSVPEFVETRRPLGIMMLRVFPPMLGAMVLVKALADLGLAS